MPRSVTDPSIPADPTADTQTVGLEPTPGPTTVVPVAVPMGPEAASEDTGSLVDPGPRPRAETRRGPIGRLWSHRWVRVAAVCLAAAIAVILVIWGIRMTHKDPGSSGPNLPPPSTTTTLAASSQSAPTSFGGAHRQRAADPVRAVCRWVPDSQWGSDQGVQRHRQCAHDGPAGAGRRGDTVPPSTSTTSSSISFNGPPQCSLRSKPTMRSSRLSWASCSRSPRSAPRARVPGCPTCTTRPTRHRPRTTSSAKTSGCLFPPRFPRSPGRDAMRGSGGSARENPPRRW